MDSRLLQLSGWVGCGGEGSKVTIRVGDTVFVRGGIPATVKGRDDKRATLTLEGDLPSVQQNSRNGYINGLTPETRTQVNEILDAVKAETDDPTERTEVLRSKVAELETDPRQQSLAKYLRAEMLHIMNTYGIRPKEYVVNEGKIR